MIYLNDKVIAYLSVKNIIYNTDDYRTGQKSDGQDKIIYWNTNKLGDEPNEQQLDAAYDIWENQQIANSNKQQAESLLQQSDWVEYASVRDVTRTPHLLNGNAFDDYRVALRGIAVNPPETEITDWPVKPDEEWSN